VSVEWPPPEDEGGADNETDDDDGGNSDGDFSESGPMPSEEERE
jgi:hypothetical protein